VSIGTGTRLGQYEVQDFIGQGAMGLVYRAYHSQLERTGAVKVMQAMTPDPDTVARFRHEAQAIAKLRHPNIVDVYDFGEFEGTPYMIVEYVPGGSLAGRMARGGLDQETALRYLRGIAAGLDYAHGHGVVHRDVKPANVLLTADDTPVLADFGLAKLMEGSSIKSMTGVTTGTPAYMAPEQVTGSRVGPPSDRYSLATIAYEMLTGAIPFDGEALMELLYAQVHREPPVPSWRNPALGARVDAVIMRGLSKDPAARWETSTAFVDALSAAVRPRTVLVESTMVMSPPAAAAVPAAPAAVAERVETQRELWPTTTAFPSPPAYIAPKRKTHRQATAIVAGALILLLAVGSVVAWTLINRQVTLSLAPDTASPGDTVMVSASHVPAGEVGEVQLWSVLRRVAFRADRNGDVSVALSIPADIDAGDHHVKICWRGACHADQLLHVLAAASATATVAPASPSAAASPTPTPTSTPCSPDLIVSAVSKSNGFTAVFECFPPAAWTVSVVQGGQPYGAGSTSGGNYYSQHFPTPTLVKAGFSAYVIACSKSGRCYGSRIVTVGL
jgi:Protein kinase domain